MAEDQPFALLKDVMRCTERGVAMNAEAHQLAINWAVAEIERLREERARLQDQLDASQAAYEAMKRERDIARATLDGAFL